MDGDRDGRWSAVVAAPSLEASCHALVRELGSRWDLPSVYLLVDGRLRCMAASGYFQVVDGFTPQTGVIGRAVRAASTVVVHDAHLDPEFVAAVPDLRSEVCAPVVVGEACVGAVSLESRTTLPPGAVEDAEEAAATLARVIGRAGGLPAPSMGQRLARLAVRLSSETDAERLRRLTVEGAIEVSGRSSAALSTVDGHGRWATSAVSGPLGPALASWSEADLALVAQWVQAGTSSHFPGGAPVPPEYDFLLRSGVQSIGVQPLVAWGSVLGVLAVADGRPRPHDTYAVTALELFASVAASCLRTAMVVDDLERRATCDPLTGLPNLAEFRHDLAAACVASAKAGRPRGTCMLLDVDHFKLVNDTRGHEVGDDVLCRLAAALQRALRGRDRLFRIGGDEFAVLLGESDDAVVTTIAQRLVAAARGCGAPVSIGSAPTVGTPDTVRSAADHALYEAKRAGRGVHRPARRPV